MAAEPDFCRDILETRIKGILKEHLKISRDISFLQVINREVKCELQSVGGAGQENGLGSGG